MILDFGFTLWKKGIMEKMVDRMLFACSVSKSKSLGFRCWVKWIERDAIACFDCLDSNGAQAGWAFQTTISNNLELGKLIPSCRFCRLVQHVMLLLLQSCQLVLEVPFVVISSIFLMSSQMRVGLIVPVQVFCLLIERMQFINKKKKKREREKNSEMNWRSIH